MNNRPGLIDLHCDTLLEGPYKPLIGPDSLNDPQSRHIALSKIPRGTRWAQCFAIFVHDRFKGEEAVKLVDQGLASFRRQMDKYSDIVTQCVTFKDIERAFEQNKFAALLTIESACALAGDLSRLQMLYDQGVRILSLSWNGENEFASGHDTEHGLSELGRKAVAEMDRLGMVLDVSHLNDVGFDEILTLTDRPFVATHSNSRAICSHKRNLTDDQVKEIVRRGGLIGFNFFVDFIRDDKDVKSFDDIYRHIEHLLEIGAGKVMAIGSDYDGAKVPEFLDSGEKALNFRSMMIERGVDEQTADDIMFNNAYRFFEKNLVK